MNSVQKKEKIACGIDLGTTNSALAWVKYGREQSGLRPAIFPVEQLVAPGEWKRKEMLPSAIYLNAEGELPAESIRLPWADVPRQIVGELAKVMGPKVPGRYVVSSKSWLCHEKIDRNAQVLPWGAPPESRKISPVDSASMVLEYLRAAWNDGSMKNRLEQLPLVLTVPASFDETARRLTVEAARRAGLGEHLTLLEEPQAAFYAWIADHPQSWQNEMRAGETVLVCDVGGGTTDFSLIAAVEDENGPGFERVAVGDHLMLGGDNMDLALAHLVESKLNQRLSVDQWTSLRAQARTAKELVLGENPPETVAISITGKGSRVVGGSFAEKLSKQEVMAAILEGFFPECRLGDRPSVGARSGFQEFGLPYESDAAVTRHLAGFLGSLPGNQLPSAILFNGGAMKPAIVRERIVKVVKEWLAQAGRDPEALRVLANPDLDLAVARGAAYYCGLRQGGEGLRLKSGLARSLYVGVAGGDSAAGPSKWLCVVPRGAGENERFAIAEPELILLAGRKVAFPLATSSIRPMDKAGDEVSADAPGLKVMPPLEADIKVGRKAKADQIAIRLESAVNPIGTVDLWCVAKNDDRRWMLEIGLASLLKKTEEAEMGAVGQSLSPDTTGVLDQATLKEAQDAVAKAFAVPKADEPEGPAQLVRRLEAVLEMGREQWPASACRSLADALRGAQENRRKTPGHEARWLNLMGFCLRPGTGQPGDDQRLKGVWGQFGAGPVFAKEQHVWVEWWVMWRRLAPGLLKHQQEEIWRRLQPMIQGHGKKSDRKIATQEMNEMLRLCASLERLEAKAKVSLGENLLQRLFQDSAQAPVALWGLGRVGTRQPIYGLLSGVIPGVSVQPWVAKLISYEPVTARTQDALRMALLLMARKDLDRSLDLDEGLRMQVAGKLQGMGVKEEQLVALREYQEMSEELTEQALGESLPLGLKVSEQQN